MAICPECRAGYGDDVQSCPEHGCELVPDDLLLPADVPLAAGTMVGEYRIERKLGAGTFGDVYAGEQPLIGKRVAIKVLNQRFASDPVMVSRFVAEARAVNKIRQRNIIDIFSFGVLPGLDRHYFVMELLEGLTLGELMDRSGRLPLSVVLPIVRDIAEALDAVHEAGITHRDLKPDNVFLGTERDGSYFPKLLDFGIAKLIGDEAAHRTGPGMVMGTPRYMSPEQARGKVAEVLFQQARDLFKQENYAEACPRFAESQALEPKLGTLLNLAVCHEKLGKIATAWAEYTSAATVARRENRKEREDFARDRVAALEPRITHVVLQIAAPVADLVVSLDDQPLDHTALNVPLPIDPGTHRVTATARGKIAWSTTIEAPPERAEIPVKIPALESTPPPIAAASAPPAQVMILPAAVTLPAPPVAEVTAPPARNDNRFIAYAGFGVGAAGALVGVITGGIALARAGTIRDACHDNFCAATQTEAISSATTIANVSNVSFAIAGLGVGVVALLVSQPHAAPTMPAVAMTPILGPGIIGLRGAF